MIFSLKRDLNLLDGAPWFKTGFSESTITGFIQIHYPPHPYLGLNFVDFYLGASPCCPHANAAIFAAVRAESGRHLNIKLSQQNVVSDLRNHPVRLLPLQESMVKIKDCLVENKRHIRFGNWSSNDVSTSQHCERETFMNEMENDRYFVLGANND